MPDLIIGIDLGTSTSAIGYFTEVKGRTYGSVNLVPGGFGMNWFPSAVLLDPATSSWAIGVAAKGMRRRRDKAPYYIVSAKRHLGIDRTIELNGSATVLMEGKAIEVTPQLALAKVLEHLKARTEAQSADFRVRKVVVAIPMVYMSHEASLTKEAVELAGLELRDFIQEPTAAALCYVHENVDMNVLEAGEKILVFDLGGGTFDITVFQLKEVTSAELALDVLTTAGARTLGGDDVDQIILHHLRTKGLRVSDPILADFYAELMDRIESDLKVPLSNGAPSSYFRINHGGMDWDYEMTAAEFDRLLRESSFTERLINVCQGVQRQVGGVNRVMLVGGSSYLPICRDLVKQIFGKDVRINAATNMQEAVVTGAVYRAAQLEGRPTGRRTITMLNHGL